MASRRYSTGPRRQILDKQYKTDYIRLPEYSQYFTVLAEPFKIVFINLSADPLTNKSYVAKSIADPVLLAIAKRLG